MSKVVSKTRDAITRFGERLERRLSTGEDGDSSSLERSGSNIQLPMYGAPGRNGYYSANQRDGIYGGARNYSSDNLAANGSGFYGGGSENYPQNQFGNPYADGMGRLPYGGGFGGPINNGYQGGFGGPVGMGQYGVGGANNVGYAPEYYVAERREVELVPAPPPRYIREQVPVPYAVDRPVPQPYPVEVSRPVPVDRPYPVAVPTPVAVDRPFPVPYPVAVRTPAPPPVRVPVPVPVPVPSPVPFYVPVGVPVPSPPPSPVMFENSVTHSQRWSTGSPAMMNQQRYAAGSPVFMNQPRYLAGSPAFGRNPCRPYGNGSFFG